MGAPGGGSTPAEFWIGHGGRERPGALEGHQASPAHLPSRCQIQKKAFERQHGRPALLSARDYVESLHQNSVFIPCSHGKNECALVQAREAPFGPRASTAGLAPGYRGGESLGPQVAHPSIHPSTH